MQPGWDMQGCRGALRCAILDARQKVAASACPSRETMVLTFRERGSRAAERAQGGHLPMGGRRSRVVLTGLSRAVHRAVLSTRMRQGAEMAQC